MKIKTKRILMAGRKKNGRLEVKFFIKVLFRNVGTWI